jgi:hypothetical protein
LNEEKIHVRCPDMPPMFGGAPIVTGSLILLTESTSRMNARCGPVSSFGKGNDVYRGQNMKRIDDILWALVVGAWYVLATAPLWATYIGD